MKAELIFILAPSLAGFLICVLLRIIMLTVENGVPELIYEGDCGILSAIQSEFAIAFHFGMCIIIAGMKFSQRYKP